MKTRILHTEFWIDEQVMDLSPLTKLLFIYFITNPHVELVPIYRVADKVIAFETGLTITQVQKGKKELIELGKIRCYKDYIYIVNADRYNRFQLGEKTGKGYQKELSKIPDEVKEALLSIQSHTLLANDDRVSANDDTHRNQKEEIRNNEGDSKVKQNIADFLKNPSEEVISKFSEKFNASKVQVKNKSEDLYWWWRSLSPARKRGYSDPQAILRNALKKDFGERKQPMGKSQNLGIPEHVQEITNLPKPTPEEFARTEQIKKQMREKLYPKLSVNTTPVTNISAG